MDASQIEKKLDEFGAFFSVLNKGNSPYQWQRRLVRHAMEHEGRWPMGIDAPTGAGKTVAIEAHLFLNAIADECGLNVARRLVATVNRRALVDKQYEHACSIQKKMAESLRKKPDARGDDENVLAKAAAALLTRAGGAQSKDKDVAERGTETENAGGLDDVAPFDVVKIRGGLDLAEIDRDWRVHPTRPAVLCMTPDMFGSRLLFRGYGVRRYMRSVEAGLLAYDSVLFLDESHLNRQLCLTARQIERLEGFAELGEMKVRPLQVCASSATPDRSEFGRNAAVSNEETSGNECIEIEEADFDKDGELKKRMTAPKPAELWEKRKFSKTLKKSDYKALKEKAIKLHGENGAPVVCVFNSPKTACKFADELAVELKKRKKKTGKGKVAGNKKSDEVLCVVGNMRQYEGGEYREILSDAERLSEYDFVVGTQAIEAGIDADFAAMLTELASVEALAQRAGRVNRFGKRKYEENAAIVVWEREGEGAGGIYSDEDLGAAKEWLPKLGKDGLSPWNAWQKARDMELAKPGRVDFERLELADAGYFSKTSEDIAPESDVLGGRPSNLELWLADDFNQGTEVCFAVRHRPRCRYPDGALGPIDDDSMAGLLEALPPVKDELVACPIGRARDVVKCLTVMSAADESSKNLGAVSRAFLLRTGERPMPLGQGDVGKISPGSVVVVDEKASIFRREIVYCEKPSDKDFNADKAEKCLEGNETKEDIYLDIANMPGKSSELGPMRPVVFFEPGDGNSNEALDLFEEDASPADGRDGEWVSLVWDGEDPANGFCRIYKPARKKPRSCKSARAVAAPVYLDEHQKAVETRVGEFAETLELPKSVREALCSAGLHHDDGKADARFQEYLRKGLGSMETEEGRALAKGGNTSRKEAGQNKKNAGLPPGWRHEQLSAACARLALGEDADNDVDSSSRTDEELAVRLAGTSHGRGRVLFEQGSAELLPEAGAGGEAKAGSRVEDAGAIGKIAEELFDDGLWDELVYSTDARYGYWGVAYLEALLRAADGQVSREEGR